MAAIRWPWNWTPRPQHVEVFKAIEAGILRVLLVVHRRWGKSCVGWNLVIKRALAMPGTLHLYCGPTHGQVTQIIWSGRDHRGQRLLDYIPRPAIASMLENERQIILTNGSVIRLMSAENPDRLRGLNAITVVFDEWAVYPSGECWDVVQPMLSENAGLAAFLYTPMGEGHGKALFDLAWKNPEWFVRKWNITQTRRDGPGEDGRPIISEEDREQMRRDGTPESALRRDLDCSFEAPTAGAVYGVEIEKALLETRITEVPWNAAVPVETAWDLGAGQNNAVILFQRMKGGAVHVIEALRSGEAGLPALVREALRREYVYSVHNLPHDAEQRERSSDKTLRAQLTAQGIRPSALVPATGIDAGIYAGKVLLARTWIDGVKAGDLVTSLRGYRQDEHGRPVKDGLHDHMADAWRYVAVSKGRQDRDGRPLQTSATFSVDPVSYGWGRRRGQ